ncbi:MAG: transposase [Roseiflexaceae bacterium]|nr:transposase [Roseiflexaceae bacterium]
MASACRTKWPDLLRRVSHAARYRARPHPNYVHAYQTRGVVEGVNNKLKVLKRRCDGMRSTMRLCQRLTLDTDGSRRFSPFAGATHYIGDAPRLCPKNLNSSSQPP